MLSTDDYFTQVDASTGEAEYVFDPKALRGYHEQNQRRCEVAMQLGVTPLFVDNTNICLWEMRAYVQLADNFRYAVQIFDPCMFSTVASDVDALTERCVRRGEGKDIPRQVIERMVQNFEDMPQHLAGADGKDTDHDQLDAVRMALSPFEKRAQSPKPARYAGLDVEPGVLAALGAIDLGPHFWSENGGEVSGDLNARGLSGHYLDARSLEDPKGALSPSGPSDGPFQIPARLHVTVRFFGPSASSESVAAASELQGLLYPVSFSELVFTRGGGLLCAVCSVPDGLQGLAQDGWLPHVTLSTRRGTPWRAVDSTALIGALRSAEVTDGESQPPVPPIDGGGGVEIYRGLRVGEREHEQAVDICVVRLRPAIELGSCPFVFFWG